MEIEEWIYTFLLLLSIISIPNCLTPMIDPIARHIEFKLKSEKIKLFLLLLIFCVFRWGNSRKMSGNFVRFPMIFGQLASDSILSVIRCARIAFGGNLFSSLLGNGEKAHWETSFSKKFSNSEYLKIKAISFQQIMELFQWRPVHSIMVSGRIDNFIWKIQLQKLQGIYK